MIETIWKMGVQAGFLILLVLLIRVFLKKYSKLYSYLLWMLVLVRLLCPLFLESSWSVQPDWVGDMRTVIQPDLSGNMQTVFQPDLDGDMQAVSQPDSDGKVQAVSQPMISSKTGSEDTTAELTGHAIAEAKSERTPMQIWKLLQWIWAVGAVCTACYFLFRYIKIRKQVKTAIWEKGRIWRCEGITSPFVMGVISPKIYMPYTLSDEDFSYILQHEQMHIRHKDSVVRLAGMAALCLHWWNPLVWYGIHKMNQDMEMFCDEAVLDDLSKKERKRYARLLLNFSMKQSGYPAVLSFGESNTELRICHILEKKAKKWNVSVLVAIAICGMAAVFFIVPAPKEALATDHTPDKALATNYTPDKASYSQDIYMTCGITQGEAEVFIEELIDAVKKNEREKVSEMLVYPSVVEIGAEKIYVENSTEFLQYYDSIFTDSLKETLYRSVDAAIQFDYSGIFLGSGEIWIAKSGNNLRITALSNEEGAAVRYPTSSKSFYQR